MKLNTNILNIVKTPMLEIESGLFAKAEFCQKTGSVKDRFVFLTIKKALEDGQIDRDSILVEATSGNTGISLSSAAAALGVKAKIVMPKNMSVERKDMIRRFGAEIIEVEPSDFSGAIAKRNELVASSEKYWSPMQFENTYNISVHRDFTAPEIYDDMSELGIYQWDFISGSGTGGTLMGVYEYAKTRSRQNKHQHQVIQVCPLEDDKSHGIQGINDGEDFLLDRSKISDKIRVATKDAVEAAKNFSKIHGFLVGISSGANLVASREYLAKNPGRNVVTLLCDRGERYFSII